jgi:alpha-galactosidase
MSWNIYPEISMATASAAPAAAEKGHVAHTKDAHVAGLPGVMPRPIKVVLVGAGSGFTPRLCSDIIQTPGHCGGEIVLVDIDPARLTPMHTIVSRVAQAAQTAQGSNGPVWTVSCATDRTQALAGADYLICCIEVSGLGCVRFDNDIPAKYGVDQCIGDTVGPGGLFKGLRTIPPFLEILRDAERLCPGALVLNYTNPMSMMCLAAARSTSMPVVGLCHSVQGASQLMAKRAGVPHDELEWECAGVNHLAWMTKLRHRGRDLYPDLMAKARADLAGNPVDPEDAADLVRKDMMLHFGAWITESSGHLSEYLPFYRKRKDLIERYCRPRYDGESSFYANNWPSWRANADQERARMVDGQQPIGWARSHEYAAFIIEAREKNSPFTFHGTVLNRWNGGGPLIDNLPHDGVVEVKILVDRNGLQPLVVGRLPPQMAALCAANMAVYDLAAEAAIHRSKEAAIHALMLDPLTAACCSPTEIRAMALELFEAETAFLPGYH